MNKTKDDLRILYMQLRKDKASCDEEYADMARLMGLRQDQLRVWNVFTEVEFPVEEVAQYDALVAGGSSDDAKDNPYLSEDVFPGAEAAKAVMKYCFDTDVPTFAACMGFLVALEVLGAKILIDEEHHEEGYYDIFPTDAAKNDVIFADASPSFPAISFHKKRAVNVPDGCVLLASSQLCKVHAIRKKNAPFYAFQFHPEMPRAGFISKLERYIDRYFSDERTVSVLQRMIDTCPEMDEANGLLKKFVDRVLLGQNSP